MNVLVPVLVAVALLAFTAFLLTTGKDKWEDDE